MQYGPLAAKHGNKLYLSAKDDLQRIAFRSDLFVWLDRRAFEPNELSLSDPINPLSQVCNGHPVLDHCKNARSMTNPKKISNYIISNHVFD